MHFLARAGVEDDDVTSLQFVFHTIEKPAFIGAVQKIRKMTSTRIEYTLDGADADYGKMLLSMQLVANSMLNETSDVMLGKIVVEVERERP